MAAVVAGGGEGCASGRGARRGPGRVDGAAAACASGVVRPSQRQQFRLGELLLELLGGGRDPSVGHRQEAREHGVGISRHAFKEMRECQPCLGP